MTNDDEDRINAILAAGHGLSCADGQLLLDALIEMSEFYGQSLAAPCPTGSHCGCVPVLKSEIERLEAVVKALATPELEEMHAVPGRFSLRMRHHLFCDIIEATAQMLEDAQNFVALEATSPTQGPLIVTIQRAGKLTPAEKYLQLGKENDALRAEIAALKNALPGSLTTQPIQEL